MTKAQAYRALARDIDARLNRFPRVEVSRMIMDELFRQPERSSPLGDAVMNFVGLPTEQETMASWARANGLTFTRGRDSWFFTKREER